MRVNLNALPSRLFAICSSLGPSLCTVSGTSSSSAISNASAFSSATGRNWRCRLCAKPARLTSSRVTSILPASILDRSRMSLIRRSRFEPDSWITRADSTSSGLRLPRSLSASVRDRISRLFRGVRSSCDMLARKSDLYWLARASSSAFCSVSCWSCSSTFFCSLSVSVFWRSSSLEACSSSACTRSSSSEARRRWLCSSSSTVLPCSSSLVAASSSCCMRSSSSEACSSRACNWVRPSRSCVRSARRRLSSDKATTGSRSSSSASCVAVKRWKLPNSSTPSSSRRSSSGSTMTLRGVASPSPEWMRM